MDTRQIFLSGGWDGGEGGKRGRGIKVRVKLSLF